MSQMMIKAALETAFKALPNIVPAVNVASSTSGSSSVFETTEPHLLVSGLQVELEGHVGSVPQVDGLYKVVVINETKFSLKDVDTGVAVTLSVGGVGGSIRANLIAWNNLDFAPISGVPYERVNVLFGKPENPSYGGDHVREIGFMQVTMYHPKNQGTYEQSLRNEMIRAAFKHKTTFEKNGIIINVSNTPESIDVGPQEEAYVSVLRIPFWADVFA